MTFESARREYYTENALNRLAAFATVRGLETQYYEQSGVGMLMLRVAGIKPVGNGRLSEYLDQYRIAADEGIYDNCFAIADDCCRAGRASYQLCAYGTDATFTGWSSHCISYDWQPDGTAVGYDLTAGKNLLEDRGDFHVLGLHTADLYELQDMTGRLYGGDWKIFDDGR
jgi:hypothetical protein